MTIWRMCIACSISNATDTFKQVIIFAFLLQQWLHERPSMLRHAYNTCLVQHILSGSTWKNTSICKKMRVKNSYIPILLSVEHTWASN
jgi:hypothetical protein